MELDEQVAAVWQVALSDEGPTLAERIAQFVLWVWEAFERPKGVLAEAMTVERAELSVKGNFAILLYWVDVEGGARWDYTDQYFIAQVMVKQQNQWRTAHDVEAGSLDDDVQSQQPGERLPSTLITPTRSPIWHVPLACLTRVWEKTREEMKMPQNFTRRVYAVLAGVFVVHGSS